MAEAASIALGAAALLLIAISVVALRLERVAARSRAALAENQERLAFALEGSNDGLWDVQLPSNSIYLSPRGCEILGFRPDELSRVAAAWDQLVHPDDRPATRAALDAYLEGRAPIFEVEQRLRTAAGEWKWVAVRGKAVARDAAGAPTRMVGTYTDISARKRAEEELRVNEERLRLALDSADLGLFDLNVQTGETIVNDEYARMLGYDPADFHEADAAWIERIHPDDREAVAAADRDYAAGKVPQYRVEFRQRTRSGDWKWTLLVGRFVEWDAQGAPLRMLGTHLDISARKQAEEQLRAAAEEMARLLEAEVRSRRALLSIVEDQRATEAALRDSEARYRSIINASPDDITITDLEGRILMVSPAALPMFGLEREEELLGRVITDFIVPEDQDRAWSNVALKFAGVITGPDEYRGLRRDGSTFDIEVNGEFIRDADGQPTSVVFVVRDITERKRTDRALRESEIRMRAITDSAQDGIVMMDPEGRVSYWNPAAERMFGYTSAEATGQYLLTLLAPSRYLEAFRAAFPAFLQTGRGAAIGTTLDWMGRRADGQEFPVQLSLSAVQLDGRWHAVGLLQDVTQRKRAEAALRDSEERYRALVEWSPEPTCVHRGGKFIYVNPAFIKMFGATSAQDLVGKPILDRVHPDFHQIVLARAKIIADHGVTPMIEERYRKLDGTAIDVEVQATSIVYDGAPAIHASIRDITERKRAEAEIGALNEELEQRVVARTAELAASNKELESFSYSVSHDLRAPLRAISGFAAILGRRYRDGLDEKGRHYVDTIVDSSEHMGVLIEELLDYSRLGRAIVRAEPVPLGPLVTGLRATFGERIAAAGATLEVIEPLATPVGDPTLLERILANLIDNALTYHRSDVATRVTLSATRRGRRVALAVADNGIGIPAEYRERIFEVFARLHSADEYPGTGIGLSIVRKAARLMGSDVTVESTEGAGSTFSFELPAATKRSSKP